MSLKSFRRSGEDRLSSKKDEEEGFSSSSGEGVVHFSSGSGSGDCELPWTRILVGNGCERTNADVSASHLTAGDAGLEGTIQKVDIRGFGGVLGGRGLPMAFSSCFRVRPGT